MAGRILIAGGSVEGRETLATLLRSARYDAITAEANDSLHAVVTSTAPDLILLDDSQEGLRGVELCGALKADPNLREIPVIISANRDDSEARREALEAGADELLRKPHNEVILMARLRSILRMRETSEELQRRQTTAGEFGFAEANASFSRPGRIGFIVSADGPTRDWRVSLGPMIRHRLEVMTPEEALEQGTSGRAADVFVLDLAGDKSRGMRLIPELRSRSQTRHAGILVICPGGDSECAAMALDLGANDLVPADFDNTEIAIRLRTQLQRKRHADTLRNALDEDLRMAVLDPLTGLYNRRYAMAHLKRLSQRAADNGRDFTVMVADLDRFKAINDQWGHAAGDAVLVEVARRLKDNLRGNDLIARIGGEEFLVALPDCDLSEARQAGERLCRTIDCEPIALPGGERVHVTISVGVAVGGGARGLDVVASLIDDADRALYGAKAEGRNQVTIGRPAA